MEPFNSTPANSRMFHYIWTCCARRRIFVIFFIRICSLKCKTHVFPPFHTHSHQSNGPHCKVEITQASALSLLSPQEIWKHLFFFVFFTSCPFIRVLSFFLYFRVRCKTNQTLRRRCARLRGGSTGAAGALIKGAKKGSRVKVPRRDEAPAVSRVCISQPVALPRWSWPYGRPWHRAMLSPPITPKL